ncbi:MAG: aa3-type cytochrome oxidase subunit IV [Candidatus Planktophila sp.]
MKTNWMLFAGLSIFYFIMTIIYWQVNGEALGITGLLLAGGLAGMVGFYVWFTQKRIGKILPEDNAVAEISDGAGELGFFSPHSWWPLPTGLAAVAAGLSLIIGWWFTLIAVSGLIISVIGWVTEYEKPLSTSSH